MRRRRRREQRTICQHAEGVCQRAKFYNRLRLICCCLTAFLLPIYTHFTSTSLMTSTYTSSTSMSMSTTTTTTTLSSTMASLLPLLPLHMYGPIEDLYEWIDSYPITRVKRNINRDFADGVPLAEMLKAHFPKLVDLHNYVPSSMFAQKLDNWRLLQRKVLRRALGVAFAVEDLERVARAEAGAIESLLWQVKEKLERIEERQRSEANLDDVYTVEGLDAQLNGEIVPIRIKQGSTVYEQRMVPANVFDEMKMQLETHEEQLKQFRARIKYLEEMLELKNSRIEDLCAKLKEQQCLTPTKRFLNHIF